MPLSFSSLFFLFYFSLLLIVSILPSFSSYIDTSKSFVLQMDSSQTLDKDDVPDRWDDDFDNLFQVKLFTSLANDSEVSPSAAVASFLEHTAEETLYYKGGHENWAYAAFHCLFEVARRTSEVEKLDKLVQFVIQLQKIKLDDPETGERLEIAG
ncbi:hypothetical protein VHEMI00270 [[Torrubiella] hemipterigena]|uniref:Uncharacterized protein n=1 Tax=[Torrubiella] hemipterigena TaxID=1531966 RepID=A0A0A1T1S9_9HYPO|nr:hypothetical protein VHEMI00270 [[Torrubiella] hemipterigena]